MKNLILPLVTIFLICTLFSYAQTDTLVIKLKNGQTDKIAVSSIQKIQFENVTGIDETSKGASSLVTNGNYPNPFQDQTNIEFEIPSNGSVVIIIYDNTGSQIQKLECQDCQTGKNTLSWNCIDKFNNKVQSGVYYYEVHYGKEVQSKKMIVVK